MKKIILSLVLLLTASTIFAQTPEEKAALKAQQQALKEAQALAKKQVAEAIKVRDEILPNFQKADATPETKEDAKNRALSALESIQEALNSGNVDSKKLFEAWKASDDLATIVVNNELTKAASQLPFDTVAFHKALLPATKSKQNVLKYGNKKDDTQKLVLAGAELNLANSMMFFAYDGQFNLTSNPQWALESFDTYLNYENIFPEVASHPKVVEPVYPKSQIAYYAFMGAFDAKMPEMMNKYYDLAIQFEQGAEGVKQRKVFYYLQEGDTVKWASECRKMALSEPQKNLDVIQNLLAYYQKQGIDHMSEFADEVIAVDPNNLIANYGKGFVYFSKEEYEQALPYYEKCIEIDPTYADAFIQAGTCCSNIGAANNRKINDKIKSYKTQAAADADIDSKVKSYYRRAIPYFEKVRELMPNEPGRWAYELKICYGVIGDKAKEKEMDALY